MVLSLGAQPLQHRLQLGKTEVEQRVVDLVKFPDELGRALAAAEALLKLVQSVGFVIEKARGLLESSNRPLASRKYV